jgi:uncharacterized membrane protein
MLTANGDSVAPSSSRALPAGAANAVLAAVFVGGFVALAWTTSWYAAFKAMHVLAAVAWVGGIFTIQVYSFLVMRSRDTAEMFAFAQRLAWIGMRVWTPASLSLLAFGVVLQQKADWGYPFWILFAFVIWGLSFASGIGFLGPESGRIVTAINEEGAYAPAVLRRIERTLVFSRVELVLVTLAVVDMVLKPGQ